MIFVPVYRCWKKSGTPYKIFGFKAYVKNFRFWSLYTALKEECFYTDHTEIVKDSFTKVRKGLEHKKKAERARWGMV